MVDDFVLVTQKILSILLRPIPFISFLGRFDSTATFISSDRPMQRQVPRWDLLLQSPLKLSELESNAADRMLMLYGPLIMPSPRWVRISRRTDTRGDTSTTTRSRAPCTSRLWHRLNIQLTCSVSLSTSLKKAFNLNDVSSWFHHNHPLKFIRASDVRAILSKNSTFPTICINYSWCTRDIVGPKSNGRFRVCYQKNWKKEKRGEHSNEQIDKSVIRKKLKNPGKNRTRGAFFYPKKKNVSQRRKNGLNKRKKGEEQKITFATRLDTQRERQKGQEPAGRETGWFAYGWNKRGETDGHSDCWTLADIDWKAHWPHCRKKKKSCATADRKKRGISAQKNPAQFRSTWIDIRDWALQIKYVRLSYTVAGIS